MAAMIHIRSTGLGPAAAVVLALFAGLYAGLLPLAMPFGLAAGGVLETGQVSPERWWLGAGLAIAAFALLSWKLQSKLRLWWLAVLMVGMTLTILTFCHVASSGQVRSGPGNPLLQRMDVGVMTALPLFWGEGGIAASLSGTRPGAPLLLASRHRLRAIDSLDPQALGGLGALLLAQPRLLAPEELVALDAWVRDGGRAVILADPLLVWPGDLAPGDPRRAPLTSLLDPLLSHWGLRLEPAAKDSPYMHRRMLASGHVILTAAASRFSLRGDGDDVACVIEEAGLFASCSIGKGQARLIADADLIDDRLWLANSQHADKAAAYSSDAVPLIDDWLADPAGKHLSSPPRRVAAEASLVRAMRLAMLAAILWVGLGWWGSRRFATAILPQKMGEDRNRSGTNG
ncbi:MAG: hypothetical protein AB7U35_07755 [Sphingobium sp.]